MVVDEPERQVRRRAQRFPCALRDDVAVQRTLPVSQLSVGAPSGPVSSSWT
jgi:hypothetical protein